jgi:hypothetical protein
MNDRKQMKKVKEKRIISTQKQIEDHEDKIKHEKPRKDTTEEYWKKEIDEKFVKQVEKDEEYMEKH